MKVLVVIPARGGSKGIPHKNIKLLHGKPLITYTIDVAKMIFPIADICVSTDDQDIIAVAEKEGLSVPFWRPPELALDTTGTYDVLLHAVQHYENRGIHYDALLLLQPTSPFRTVDHVKKALSLYTPSCDMVVSVKETSSNPYYNCFEDNEQGFLTISKGDGQIVRRQDAPKVWEYNGAIYVINIESLKKEPLSKFKRRIKYPMNEFSSLDLDTLLDWEIAETLMNNKLI